jgi:hypothetical protein
LRFVDDHFMEACRDSAAKASRPLGISQSGQGLDPCVSRAQISLSPKGSASLLSYLLIGGTVCHDMRAQTVVSDERRIDRVSGRIEAIEGYARPAEGGASTQPDLDAECVPAIYNGGPNVDALKAVGRNEELPQERIEGANEIRMARYRIETKRPALGEKLVDSRIGERQDRDALPQWETRYNVLGALDDRARFSTAWTCLYECLTRMLGKRALLRRGLTHPATATIASRK